MDIAEIVNAAYLVEWAWIKGDSSRMEELR
jgi:hypothetical protein